MEIYRNYFDFPALGTKSSKKKEKRWDFRNKMHSIIPQLVSTNRLIGKEKRYECEIDFYFIEIQNADIDNMLKHLFDAIKYKLIEDDKQIKNLTVKVYEYQEKTGFSLVLKDITNTTN